jgi:predicted  nucleic acid-binding Zn-ribbon protein
MSKPDDPPRTYYEDVVRTNEKWNDLTSSWWDNNEKLKKLNLKIFFAWGTPKQAELDEKVEKLEAKLIKIRTKADDFAKKLLGEKSAKDRAEKEYYDKIEETRRRENKAYIREFERIYRPERDSKGRETIINPETGRRVLSDGPIGRKILKSV